MKWLRLFNVLSDVRAEETIDYSMRLFSGGEPNIKINGFVGKEVCIEAKLHSSLEIMELFLAIDALRNMGVTYIELVAPYIPFARQDRIMIDGEAFSLKVFAKLLNSQQLNKIHVLDPHSPISTALIDNCRPIDIRPIIRSMLSDNATTNRVFISPDAGSEKKINSLSQAFQMPVVYCSKQRDISTGQVRGVEVHTNDLLECDCYIVDDICDGGITFLEIAKKLRELNCGKLILFVSHGIFREGFKQLKLAFDTIYTVNCFDKSNFAVILPLSREYLS